MNNLLLIVDTNIFHECKKLEDINWSLLEPETNIEIIVTSPVQGELDQQKNDSRPRIKRRALDINQRLRRILKNDPDAEVINSSNPRVIIKIDSTAPDRNYNHILDYSVEDDIIVATARAIADANPEKDVRLLSDDTRPAAKAQALGLPFEWIPDEWKRDPEEDEAQKEIRRLKSELSAIRQTQPDIKIISSNDENANSRQKLILTRNGYSELNDQELCELRENIEIFYPLEKIPEHLLSTPKLDDTSPEWAKNSIHFPLFNNRIIPYTIQPTLKDYENYSNNYEEWIQESIQNFRNLPVELNLQIPWRFSVSIQNEGTVPAENTLIRFTARGKILIAPPANNEGNNTSLSLPSLKEPPSPPKAQRIGMQPFENFAHITPILPRIPNLENLTRNLSFNNRDPNSFYYLNCQRGDDPSEKVELNSKSFRHGAGEEIFSLDIYTRERFSEQLNASIDIEIFADNLPHNIKKTVPVSLKQINSSPIDVAKKIIIPQEVQED